MIERKPADEAAAWVLRLQDPSANAETFHEWQRWLSAAPEHKAAFEEIEETLLRLAGIDEKPPLPSAAEMASDDYDGSVPVSDFLVRPRTKCESRSPETEMDVPARANRGLRYAIAATVTAVSIACGWLSVDAMLAARHGVYAYSTAPGERKDFTLPDGSRISLDADSALNVELTRQQRSLRLARGEAYFEVAKDPSRPFIVSAGGASVRAVGTEFNVRMGDHRTVVAVVEGRVQVAALADTATDAGVAAVAEARGAAALRLVAQVSAGQAVAYKAESGLQALSEAEASLATSWLEGRRQYRNEPLQYVLADVDRYTGRHIEIADAETAALKFTGTLNLDNSAAWLRALSIALPVTVTEKADGTVRVSFQATHPASAPPKKSASIIGAAREHARSRAR